MFYHRVANKPTSQISFFYINLFVCVFISNCTKLRLSALTAFSYSEPVIRAEKLCYQTNILSSSHRFIKCGFKILLI